MDSRIPKGVRPVLNFLRFISSLREIGLETTHNEDDREIRVKGKLRSMGFSDFGYNIEIVSKDILFNYSEYKDLTTISIWKIENVKQILLKKIWLRGSLRVMYDQQYLRVIYGEINEISELIAMPQLIDEMIDKIKKAGFSIFHDPKKRIIKIKGDVDRAVLFGLPRPFIRLKKGNSILTYEKDMRDHYIVLTDNDKDIHYKIGEGEEVSVRLEYPYLIIRYSVT